MPDRDVSPQVRAHLSPPLQALVTLIEDHFAHQIQFREATLPRGGQGCATWGNNQPKVWLASWDGDLPVVGHELLHMKRRVQGHPWIRSLRTCQEREHITSDLYNLIDEVAFVPEFIQLGFDPLHGLAPIVRSHLAAVEKYGKQQPPAGDDLGRLFALTQAWVILRAPKTPCAPRFLQVFDAPQHERAKIWGQALVEAIQKADLETPGGTAHLSRKCAEEILRLEQHSDYELKYCPCAPR